MKDEKLGFQAKFFGISPPSDKIIDNLLIFSAALIVCCRIFGPGLPAGHDTLSETFAYAAFMRTGLSILNPYWFCDYLAFIPYGGAVGIPLFGSLTLIFSGDFVFVSKIEMFLEFFVSGLSMYYFSKLFSGSRIASLVSALGYMFSQLIFIELPYEGHVSVSWGIAMAPLVFFSFEKSIRSARSFDSILAGLLTAFIAGMVTTSYVLLLSVWLLLYLIYRCLFIPGTRHRRRACLRILKVCFISGFVAALISMFWLLPLVLIGVRPVYFVIEDFKIYSPDFIHALTINLHSCCSPEYLSPLGPLSIFFGFWLPILAVVGYLLRRNRYTLFFLIAAFVSVYFAKGANPPFEQPLVWAYLYVPFFASIREGGRYLLVTSLSYSFLVGVAAQEMYALCQVPGRLERLFGKCIAHISGSLSDHGRRVLGYIPVVTIIGLILLYSWTPITSAFQTFNLPKGYADAYGWIAERGADGRVLGYPLTSWAFYEGVTPTNIIAPSSFVPIIYGERMFWGGAPLASPTYTQDFTAYLDQLIANNGTDDLSKILGLANVKYVVVDLKAKTPQVNFFSNQSGLHEVFRNDLSIVFENEWCNPLIFASPSSALVVGGRDIFQSLYEISEFNPDRWALIFGEHLYDQPSAINIIDKCNAIFFSNPGFLDFVFMTYGQNYTIKVAQYGFRSTNCYKHWIPSSWWADDGKLVLNKDTLTTYGNLSVNIPFHVPTEDRYDVWLRIAYGPNRGELSAKVDARTLLSNFQPHADFPAGFGWIKLQTVYLTAGSHTLTLFNDGTGYNDIDVISVTQSSAFPTYFNKALNAIQNSHATVVYVLEAENTFTMNGLSSWQISRNWSCYASNGYVLRSENASEASTDLFIPRSGEYIIAIRTVDGPDYGKLVLDVDGSEFIVNLFNSTTGFSWHEVGPISFNVGTHTLAVINNGSGKVDLDELIVYSLNDDENNVSLDRIFVTPQMAQVDYTEVNPTEYAVHVKAESPFWLIFSNSYHQLWRAYIGNEEIKPVVVHSFLNGFYINNKGEFDVKIRFLGQTYANIGGMASIVTFTAVMIYFIYPKLLEGRKLRKLLSALKRQSVVC